jgi:hypothetical protein
MTVEDHPHGYAVKREEDQLPYLHRKLDDTTIQRALYLSLPVSDLDAHAALAELFYRRAEQRRIWGPEVVTRPGLDESQRQATLMALAHLAVERPGWKWMLTQIALKMDNSVDGEPELFTKFFEMHAAEVLLQAKKARET